MALIYLFPDIPKLPSYTAPFGFKWLLGTDESSGDRVLLLLALASGVLDSTLHTMQSFGAFVGDRKLEASWFWWYLLRAPVGALLGFRLYVASRSGVLALNANEITNVIGRA